MALENQCIFFDEKYGDCCYREAITTILEPTMVQQLDIYDRGGQNIAFLSAINRLISTPPSKASPRRFRLDFTSRRGCRSCFLTRDINFQADVEDQRNCSRYVGLDQESLEIMTRFGFSWIQDL